MIKRSILSFVHPAGVRNVLGVPAVKRNDVFLRGVCSGWRFSKSVLPPLCEGGIFEKERSLGAYEKRELECSLALREFHR